MRLQQMAVMALCLFCVPTVAPLTDAVYKRQANSFAKTVNMASMRGAQICSTPNFHTRRYKYQCLHWPIEPHRSVARPPGH